MSRPAARTDGRVNWRQTFTALRYPNYRLWFWGQLTSLFGSWMQTTAQGFLIFELTKSAAFLGYVGFAAGIPIWMFMLYAGTIADRVSRRRLMILTQTAMLVLAFISAGLVFAGVVRPWHIIVLAFCLRGGQCLRRSGPAGLRPRSGRSRGPDQRHRPELGHVQHLGGHRSGRRRHHLRPVRTGLVLRHQWPVVPGHHRRSGLHEAGPARAPDPNGLGLGRAEGRSRLRPPPRS